MKTLNQNLIAVAAAVLLTCTSLSVVFNGTNVSQAAAMEIDGIKVTNLAPVTVYPNAGDLRSASLFIDIGVAGFATLPMLGRIGETGGSTPLSLLGSQLAMPYYSFGNKFGRISKE